MKYTVMLLSLYLLISTGAFASLSLADEADKKSQTIYRAIAVQERGIFQSGL